jgi:hypothetical protein
MPKMLLFAFSAKSSSCVGYLDTQAKHNDYQLLNKMQKSNVLALLILEEGNGFCWLLNLPANQERVDRKRDQYGIIWGKITKAKFLLR